MPTAPGLCQMRPQMPQQQAPTPGGQEAMLVMPYQQQVFPLQGTQFYSAFCHVEISFVSEVCAGLGNGCEMFCMSGSLLGSYVHQELTGVNNTNVLRCV